MKVRGDGEPAIPRVVESALLAVRPAARGAERIDPVLMFWLSFAKQANAGKILKLTISWYLAMLNSCFYPTSLGLTVLDCLCRLVSSLWAGVRRFKLAYCFV